MIKYEIIEKVRHYEKGDFNMYTVLIVEDDNKLRNKIEKMIYHMDQGLKILSACSKKSALKITELVAIDIFILDIELPDGNGIDLAKELRVEYPNQPIIIESSERDIIYQKRIHHEIENLAFLEKPFLLKDLQKKVARAIELVKNQKSRKLIIQQNGFKLILDTRDVMYFETVKGFKKIQAVSYNQGRIVKKLIHGYSLSRILDELSCKTLIQCHRSYIVNSQMITKWNFCDSQGYSLVLKHDIEIPIGKTHRRQLSLLV